MNQEVQMTGSLKFIYYSTRIGIFLIAALMIIIPSYAFIHKYFKVDISTETLAIKMNSIKPEQFEALGKEKVFVDDAEIEVSEGKLSEIKIISTFATLGYLAGYLIIFFLLKKFFQSSFNKGPFISDNIGRLKRIAHIIFALGVLDIFYQIYFNALMDTLGTCSETNLQFRFVTPLAFGVMILALTRFFDAGLHIQEENRLTI